MFNKESYARHSDWYNQKFPTVEAKTNYLIAAKVNASKNIGAWLQAIFFNCIDPLLHIGGKNWLTIGDAYGFDAQYIIKSGNLATASDLNTDFLAIAQTEGIIDNYSAQNAEHLSYNDNSFDFLLCKESYHHFPRPYAALYEMLRVAKKGFVVIEPQDPISKMPLLLGVVNILTNYRQKWTEKIWRNRFSYEPVGNFVYKISEREVEKFAAGLNLPLVAFKGINPNFHFDGASKQAASFGNPKFRHIYFKRKVLDILVRLGLLPSQVLCAIVFKEMPDEKTLTALKTGGYRLVTIPKNPFL
jgi:SAM-dependent methyltransferase